MRAFAAEYARALGRFHEDARRLLAAAALEAFARQSFGVLRNLYLKEIGYGEDAIGHIVGAASIGQAAVAIPAILLMARIGYKGGIVAALLLDVAATAAQAAATSYAPLYVASAAWGAAGALFHVVAQPCLMAVSSPEDRPFLFSVSFASMTVAGGFGSSAGGALAEALAGVAGGPVPAFRLALGASALALAAALPWALRVRIDDLAPARTGADAGRASLLDALRVREPGRIALIALPEAIIGFGAGLTIPFLQIYFRNTFGLQSFAIGSIYTAGWVGMGIGYLVAPAFARRFGARRTIVLSQALSVAFLVELAFPHGLPFAVASFVLRTTCMNLCAPVHSQYTLELVGERDRRALTPVLALVRGVSWASAASAGGWLIARSGGSFGPAMVTTAALYLLAALVGARAYRRLERARPRSD